MLNEARRIELFSPLGVETIERPLYDYGKLYRSVAPFAMLCPRDADQVCQIVSLAYHHRVPLRVRASGHTFSGATLPRKGEVLVRTPRLDHFRFEQPGTVTVGCGALVWDVRDLVRDFGYELPVYNGGWAGPTVGGYISAGGFGKSGLSEVYGGLWENVARITLVDGTGRLRDVDENDDSFPWLFGSFGQLGMLVESRLKIIPSNPSSPPPYPTGAQGTIRRRQLADPAINDVLPAGNSQSRLFWFSVLASARQEPHVWRELESLVRSHPDYLIPDGGWAGPTIDHTPIGYHYVIQFHRFNPPLVYPRAESFLVLGVMSRLTSGMPADNQRLLRLEQDFVGRMLRNGFCLYLQAENIGARVDFRQYYGERVFSDFQRVRREFDPAGLFNRGVVTAGDRT